MTRSALILAAHGGWAEPPADQPVRQCADRLARMGLFDEVAVAYHQGQPSFAAALEAVDADEVTVVPFMTSEGYYSEVVLPRELAGARKRDSMRVYKTRPVGTHPRMVPLVARRVRDIMESYRLDPGDTTLALVGHGTRRYRHSRTATVDVAVELSSLSLCAEVLPVFLEEDPRVESLLVNAPHTSIVVEPFLMGGGWHARRDIPAALGLGQFDTASRPLGEQVGRRFVACDTTVGSDPEVVEIVIDLARARRNPAARTGSGRRAVKCVPQEAGGTR